MMRLQAAHCAEAAAAGEAVAAAATQAAARPDLGGRAQQLLGAAAEVVAIFEGATLAAGLARLRRQGRRLPPAIERGCRALDAAGALLRHPGEGEAVLAQARAWMQDGAEAKLTTSELELTECDGELMGRLAGGPRAAWLEPDAEADAAWLATEAEIRRLTEVECYHLGADDGVEAVCEEGEEQELVAAGVGMSALMGVQAEVVQGKAERRYSEECSSERQAAVVGDGSCTEGSGGGAQSDALPAVEPFPTLSLAAGGVQERQEDVDGTEVVMLEAEADGRAEVIEAGSHVAEADDMAACVHEAQGAEAVMKWEAEVFDFDGKGGSMEPWAARSRWADSIDDVVHLAVEAAEVPKVAEADEDGKWEAVCAANREAHTRAAEAQACRSAQWRLEHDRLGDEIVPPVPELGLDEPEGASKRRQRKTKRARRRGREGEAPSEAALQQQVEALDAVRQKLETCVTGRKMVMARQSDPAHDPCSDVHIQAGLEWYDREIAACEAAADAEGR